MSGVSPEPRTAVMILVEASWQDQSETWVTARVRMENKSAAGACLRIKRRITPGTKIRIQWRWEEFSGVVKYCKYEAGDYRVGIQRDPTRDVVKEPPDTASVPQRAEAARTVEIGVREMRTGQQAAATGVPIAPPAPVVRKKLPSAAPPAVATPREVPVAELTLVSAVPSEPETLETLPERQLPATELPVGKEAGKERTIMGSKLMQLANWGRKEEAPQENSNGMSSNAGKRGNRAHEASAPVEKPPAPAVSVPGNFQVELLSMADIYSAAGITSPRRGYSINKVVEMLHSEHMRGLAKEMRRASVLMALDAAGVSVDEVMRDAKVRQESIDSYEAKQRKQFEALWTQKAEENMQVQAELERVKASYLERIKRNQDGVAREKATFVNWLTMKQQEAQHMAEAVELCLKPVVAEPAASEAATGASAVGVNTKLM